MACEDYKSWTDIGDDSAIKFWKGQYTGVTHPNHPGCTYDLDIKVRGRRHFRPCTFPPPPNDIGDFWTEIRIEKYYVNGTPSSSSSSSSSSSTGCPDESEIGDYTGRFPGVFLNPDWQNYANGFSLPANHTDFEEEFICGAISLIPSNLDPDCDNNWMTPLCTY